MVSRSACMNLTIRSLVSNSILLKKIILIINGLYINDLHFYFILQFLIILLTDKNEATSFLNSKIEDFYYSPSYLADNKSFK